MQHANAPLTPNGRLRMVRLVVEDGLTFEAAAAASNVAKSTVHLWVMRWREAGDEERRALACLEDRPSRPRTSPNQVPAEEAERICERRRRTGWSPRRLADEPDIRRPHSTVHQVVRRGGCSRRPRPERPAVVRYEWPCPGNLLHMDVKKLGRFEAPGHALTVDRSRRSRGAGWEYVHSIVDDCSRLAYSEIHPDEKAQTVTAFTRGALDWLAAQGIVVERLMSDNPFSYTQNRSLKQLLSRRAIRHIRTRPYTPRTNGKVERFHQTLMREWAYALEYASSDGRREKHHNNWRERPMTGELAFFELGVDHTERGRAFFEGLFGWKFETGPSGEGFVITTPNVPGGMHGSDEGAAPYVFFHVDDMQAAIARVRELGGQVEEMDVEGDEASIARFGRFKLCRDDQGSPFGLHQPPSAS